MAGALKLDTSEMNVIFVHSCLDDAGLTPKAFRIYGHIARRAGRGDCYASNATMAEHCGMDVKTVKEAIRELLERNMLARESRLGFTTVYTITTPSKWTPADGGPKNTPGRKTDHPLAQKTDQDLVRKTDHKGDPTKELQKGNPTIGVLEPETEELFKKIEGPSIEEIYQAYPRKVGKPAALKAIAAAIKKTKIPPPELLAKTKDFALSRAETEEQYIPHPATWFNQHRFNDPLPSPSQKHDNATTAAWMPENWK